MLLKKKYDKSKTTYTLKSSSAAEKQQQLRLRQLHHIMYSQNGRRFVYIYNNNNKVETQKTNKKSTSNWMERDSFAREDFAARYEQDAQLSCG